MSAEFTIVGGRGFIGAALVAGLRERGYEVRSRRSGDPPGGDRGHVIYASGIAWDAHLRPMDAFELHVERVRRSLGVERGESFTYLSSTRVYDGAAHTGEEAPLRVRPASAADTYAISKIAGENLILAQKDARLRVVRLSNVFGRSFRSELFLSQILRQAVREGRMTVRTSRASAKDYVGIDDVVDLIPRIAAAGRERLYNVARGENTTNGTILDAIAAAAGAEVRIEPGAPTIVVPAISVGRLAAEFGVPQARVEDAIPALVRAFAEHERRGRA